MFNGRMDMDDRQSIAVVAMHLHGFFFLLWDKNGEPVHPLEWKDTVNVPFNDSVKLLVCFDERPGSWMVHCHILEHAEGGLMTTVQAGDGPYGLTTTQAHNEVQHPYPGFVDSP